jgi:transcriptional regulator with XRE-family HTH domain
MNELGTLLVNLRKRAGLSQTEVASRANISGGYLSQLETGARGDRIPSITIERLAQALGADKKALLLAANMRINADDLTLDERPQLEDFIQTEPTLSASEKSVLLSVLSHMRANPAHATPDGATRQPGTTRV